MNYYLKALRNYATFNGRATRSEYWYFVLFNCIIAYVIGVIDGFLKMHTIGTIYILFILIPTIAVGVRRIHDVGKSGWYILVPIYNLVLFCTRGDKQESANESLN
jgi:uncharacterized membrane protein YhaH (DUF805 family)